MMYVPHKYMVKHEHKIIEHIKFDTSHVIYRKKPCKSSIQ